MAQEKKPEINSELLQKIFKRSARRLLALAVEGEEDLLEVIHRKAEAAQDEKSDKLTVTFTHKITVDFAKNTQEDSLGGSIKVGMKLKADMDETEELPGLWSEED